MNPRRSTVSTRGRLKPAASMVSTSNGLTLPLQAVRLFPSHASNVPTHGEDRGTHVACLHAGAAHFPVTPLLQPWPGRPKEIFSSRISLTPPLRPAQGPVSPPTPVGALITNPSRPPTASKTTTAGRRAAPLYIGTLAPPLRHAPGGTHPTPAGHTPRGPTRHPSRPPVQMAA